MKSVSAVLLFLLTLLLSTDIVSASDIANGVSLRNRHYATCMDGATPRETFYIKGHYVIAASRTRYVGSCSPKKHGSHRSRIAAYNYGNYMN